MPLQGSLLDLDEELRLHPVADGLQRRELGLGAWLDIRPGLLTGADLLFTELLRCVPWRAERRQMYDRVLDVPRLLAYYPEGATLPHPMVEECRRLLSKHYAQELGEPFATAGLCLYRDGKDSVAWHGDRTGRSWDEDTMIAIVSLGSARDLALRPRTGGPSIKVAAGHGDLIVMGGSCQRTWDHAVLKTTRAVGPRISIQFRVRGVR